MNGSAIVRGIPALLLMLQLVACGGGTSTAGGGTGGTGITAVVSRGPIVQVVPPPAGETAAGVSATGGSVVVNGVTYDITDATVNLPLGAATLREGMVVTVRGSVNADGINGAASQVSYSRELVGMIATLPAANHLLVYGQSVLTDNLTRYEPVGCVPAAGQWIEASGFLAADGSLRATYVECGEAGDSVELSGIVTAVGSDSITLGNATMVNVGSDVYDLTTLSVGLAVQVHALLPDPSATTLTATELEVKDDLGGADGEGGEVSGLITAMDALAQTLVVAGQGVLLTADTQYSGGTVTELAVGVRVEIEGAFVAGQLVAEEVEFEDALTLSSVVATVAGDSFTLQGLPGVTVTTDALLTESDIPLPPALGTAVDLRARIVGTAPMTLFATRIEAGDIPAVEWQVPVDGIAADHSYISVLGVQVPTPDSLDYVVDDASVPKETFFAALTVGALIDAHGELIGGNIAWQEIELEE